MANIYTSADKLIGGTPLLELTHIEKELGLKCSFDRENMTIYQNQIGFIDYVEIPFYSLFVEYFPKLKFLLNNLNNNKKKILTIQEKEKEKEIKNQKKDNKWKYA